MDYRFVVLREAGWAAFIAIGTSLLQALVMLDPSVVTDWRSWAISLGVAGLKAGAAALLASWTKGFVFSEPRVANPGG